MERRGSTLARTTNGSTAPESPAGARHRCLIILRAGDSSLHASWLDPSRRPRNWDLHISYFGSKGAPDPLPPFATWSQDDDKTKWAGIASAIERRVFSLDDYDYVAMPDDDVIMTADSLSRAFDMAREYDLAACQLSLYADSIFAWPATLRQPLLKLHYVSRIELMTPIIRADVVKRMLPFLRLPGNLWAMDHVVATIAGEKPRAIAVLDECSALHTRAYMTSAMYGVFADRRNAPVQAEVGFLREHGFDYIVSRITDGGVLLNGRPIKSVWWAWLTFVRARLLRKFRAWQSDLSRIAAVDRGRVVVMRRMRGTAGLPVDYKTVTGRTSGGALASLAKAVAARVSRDRKS